MWLKLAQDYIPEWEREKRWKPFGFPSNRNDSGIPDLSTNRLTKPEITKIHIPHLAIKKQVDSDMLLNMSNINFDRQMFDGWLSPEGKFFPVASGGLGHATFELNILKENGIVPNLQTDANLSSLGWSRVSYAKWDIPYTGNFTQKQQDFIYIWLSLYEDSVSKIDADKIRKELGME